MSLTFKEVLKSLPDVNQLIRIELYDLNGNFVDKIDNLPGTQGSLKVYFYLYKTFKVINLQAAQKGLALFSEHTINAKENPGSHPNIDRLIKIIETNNTLNIKTILR
ncbi:MAG: DUF2322 family protein [Nitrosomonadales bacterium]|mgnify:FL=1|nr:DUF2322 family protein [Nitrosomonadales bacterium]MBT7482779.1 DUF2322 family protein [Nitrosomonadales bacterium]